MESPTNILRTKKKKKKRAKFRPVLAEVTCGIKKISSKNKIYTQNSRNTFLNFYVEHRTIKEKHHICVSH